MFLESRNILVEVIETLHRNSDLVFREVGVSGFEDIRDEGFDVRQVFRVRSIRPVGIQRDLHLVLLHQVEHVRKNGCVHGKTGRVKGIRHDGKNVLQDFRVISFVEVVGGRLVLGHVLQELEKDLEAGVRNVSHGVLEGPDDGIEYQLELGGGNCKKRREGVVIHRLQQEEEIGSVVRKLFKVFVDHGKRALEEGVEDRRHRLNDVHLQLIDERGHRGEDFGFPRGWDARALVIQQHSVEQRRQETLHDERRIFGPTHPPGDELERLLLDDPHAFDEWLLSHRLSVVNDSSANVFAHHFIYIQHIEIYSAELVHVRMA